MMRALCLLLLFCLGVARAEFPSPPKIAPPSLHRVLVLLQLPPPHFRPESAYGGGYGDGMGRAARRRLAAELAQAQGLSLAEDWPMPLAGVDCYVMDVPADKSLAAVAAALSQDARVAWAQPVNSFRGQGHNDPLYPVQPAARAWHLSELHAHSTGRGVQVAVVDSGVEVRHPDLAGQVGLAENFVDAEPLPAERHGTGVAGVIAARADNAQGIVGIAPDAHLMALRACWPETAEATQCSSLSVAKALHFAIDHAAQIINLSFSGPPDPLLARLLDVAQTHGITVVAAVDRAQPNGGFPASYKQVVAVADVAPGPLPAGALQAPGRDIPTTVPGGGWYLVSGSSYAAAHVSGLFALLYGLHDAGAHPSPRTALALTPGGEIDSCATLGHATGACVCGCPNARATP